MRTMLVVLFILPACNILVVDPSLEVPAPPGAEEAIQMVAKIYGRPGARPEVHWYGPKAKFCSGTCGAYTRPDGTPGRMSGLPFIGFENPFEPTHCIGGVTQVGLSIVMAPLLDVMGNPLPIWTTSLEHELLHNESVFGVTVDHPEWAFGKDPHVCGEGYGSLMGKAFDALYDAETPFAIN